MYDFPNSPTVNQVFGNYIWDGEKWKQTTTGILPSVINPLMDGSATPGTSLPYSREDHVHPSDTSRVVKSGDTMTGNLTVAASLFVTNPAMSFGASVPVGVFGDGANIAIRTFGSAGNIYFQNASGGTNYAYFNNTTAYFLTQTNCNLQSTVRAQAGGNANRIYADENGTTMTNFYWNRSLANMTMAVGAQNYSFSNSAGGAYMAGGGPWLNSSDERIKTVTGDYTNGLSAIKALVPVRYIYKGNDTGTAPANVRDGEEPDPTKSASPTVPYPNSMHYGAALEQKEFIGLIAQAVEGVMPEMVTLESGYIDGVKVDDKRTLNTGPLLFALVNAVKELTARLEALEAKP